MITPPANLPLTAGGRYYWTVDLIDSVNWFYYYLYQGQPQVQGTAGRVAGFDDRLGASGPSPMRPVGPVSVNLATGNVVAQIAPRRWPHWAGRWARCCPTTAGRMMPVFVVG